jgi:tRNA threonylcarbamoyladenosine biosynthesis protein TsaE
MKAAFHIDHRADTTRLGVALAGLLQPGDVIGLAGDLGAGKTYLSGVIAHALGVPDDVPVPSPTFVLIREYGQGRLPVYHMDLYRLGDPSELYDLGLWEYYEGSGVCLVEWFDRFGDLWPPHALKLSLALGPEERRTIRAEGTGRGAALLEGLLAAWEARSEK